MKIRDLRKCLDGLDPEMDVQIKGFPPDTTSVEIRYDINIDKMLIIPGDGSEQENFNGNWTPA